MPKQVLNPAYFQKLFLYFIFLLFASGVSGQTVGTVYFEEIAKEKLSLINPVNGTDCYLIDNCGFIIRKWETEYRAGLSAYLDASGNLYRSGRVNSNVFRAGGLGGIIEKYSWDGSLLWQYEVANDSMHLHHDFFVKPDGNMILIAWELISEEKLLLAGRQNINSGQAFYSEQILEIDPNSDFEIVWSWRAFEHIVQESDASLENFGPVSENPQLFDINMNDLQGLNYLDWLHINSIDLHKDHDILLLSCNAINEVIVLDYSTTREESKGHSGGKYGKGGDILYRIGNAGNYDARDHVEQRMFAQHDARWFYKNDEKLSFSIFNNGLRNGNINYSTVDQYLLDFSEEALGQSIYELEPELEIPAWSYNSDNNEALYSKRMSSARYLNGHWFVCSSDEGSIIELDENDKIIWHYINPVGPNQVFAQSEEPFGNVLFNAPVYLPGYFNMSVDLNASLEKIEREATEGCIDVISSAREQFQHDYRWSMTLNKICFTGSGQFLLTLHNMQGKRIWQSGKFENDFCSDLNNIHFGIYLLDIEEVKTGSRTLKKIIPQH